MLTAVCLAIGLKDCVTGPRPTPCPPQAVRVTPQTWQTMPHDQRVFCLAPGEYRSFAIVPTTGQSFVGEYGAILDGGNDAQPAFSGSANNVEIRNFTIRHYAMPLQHAPVDNRTANGSAWRILNNEIAFNTGAGVELSSASLLQGNYLHHNSQEGFACGGHDVRIIANEIAFNNSSDKVAWDWEAGGGKCWATDRLVMQYNYSHDNGGIGLWTDTDNLNTLYRQNYVAANHGPGIQHEVSYDAVIESNILRGNGTKKNCTGWIWCSQIMISSSGGHIIIRDNQVWSDGALGQNTIGVAQQKRGSGRLGPWQADRIEIQNNRVEAVNGGQFGGVTDCPLMCGLLSGHVTARGNRISGEVHMLTENNPG